MKQFHIVPCIRQGFMLIEHAFACVYAIYTLCTRGKMEGESAAPYLDAAPMCDTRRLDSLIRAYKTAGGHVCIVSWCAKGDISHAYYTATQAAKCLWLRKHLPSIDDIRIVNYGIPKYLVVKDVRTSVLFDDEEKNRRSFIAAGGSARLPRNLIRFIVAMLKRA